MAISIYDKRALMQMSEELKQPTRFLTTTFFNAAEEFASATVDLDIYKGKRRTAAYVKRVQEGNHVEKIGYETKTFAPPVLKPKKVITASDLQKRMPGQFIYDNASSLTPAVEQYIAREIAELNGMIERNEEWQAKQALFDGAITFYDENQNLILTIDFGRDSALVQTITTKWDNTAADPLRDLREYRRLIQQKSGFAGRRVLMGADAADEFLANEAVQKTLSKDWSTRGNIAYDMRDQGGIWLGYADGFDFWAYEDFIIDPSTGSETAIVPAKKVLISSDAPATRVYGSVEVGTDTGMIIEANARYIDIYGQKDPAGVVLQIHSTPLLVPNHIDSYAVLTVLT